MARLTKEQDGIVVGLINAGICQADMSAIYHYQKQNKCIT